MRCEAQEHAHATAQVPRQHTWAGCHITEWNGLTAPFSHRGRSGLLRLWGWHRLCSVVWLLQMLESLPCRNLHRAYLRVREGYCSLSGLVGFELRSVANLTLNLWSPALQEPAPRVPARARRGLLAVRPGRLRAAHQDRRHRRDRRHRPRRLPDLPGAPRAVERALLTCLSLPHFCQGLAVALCDRMSEIRPCRGDFGG